MLKYVHHVHYVIENLDAVVEYFEKNFGMKPDRIEMSKGNHPAREAFYHAGMTEIQISEPLTTTSSLAKHMAKHGPGVYHVAWGVSDAEAMQKRALANGNEMRQKEVIVAKSSGNKTVNIEKSTSYGLGFQLIEDPKHEK